MVKKTRNIGIDLKVPENACENDKHCPFHGEISLRGRVIKATVIRAKVAKNALVESNRVVKNKKYERYEKKRTRIIAHNPACLNIKEGDIVKIMETRKISKTKSFVIIEKLAGEKI